MEYEVKGKINTKLTFEEMDSLPDSIKRQVTVCGGSLIVESDLLSKENLDSLPRTRPNVLRNKKVDVPTEQWQKAVEKQFFHLDTLVDVVNELIDKVENNHNRLGSHALAIEKLINKE